ncbi:hypothetical protein PSCLAVI8L_130040 [Pseudoclavibacter sp. 8L]|nr:hypothetical protein PSCLAVI8L_130040 [Pseudoclavibacter sp. 8L]
MGADALLEEPRVLVHGPVGGVEVAGRGEDERGTRVSENRDDLLLDDAREALVPDPVARRSLRALSIEAAAGGRVLEHRREVVGEPLDGQLARLRVGEHLEKRHLASREPEHEAAVRERRRAQQCADVEAVANRDVLAEAVGEAEGAETVGGREDDEGAGLSPPELGIGLELLRWIEDLRDTRPIQTESLELLRRLAHGGPQLQSQGLRLARGTRGRDGDAHAALAPVLGQFKQIFMARNITWQHLCTLMIGPENTVIDEHLD